MNEYPLTPEEFARLLALPEAHPDRQRAEASPRFAAMKALHLDFESGRDAALSANDIESARAELARRIAPALGAVAEPRAARRPSGIESFIGRLHRPAGRLSLAFAVLVMVAGIAWWSSLGTQRQVLMRGDEGAGAAFETLAPRVTAAGLMLTWRAVADADAYRVVILGPDLAEIARFEAGVATEWLLVTDSLPAGLPRGGPGSVEIWALRGGDVIATTPVRAIQLP